MEPRQTRKKRSAPKRNGISFSESFSQENTEASSNSVKDYLMNLYGSGELFA